jgi:hypothetical protein
VEPTITDVAGSSDKAALMYLILAAASGQKPNRIIFIGLQRLRKRV